MSRLEGHVQVGLYMRPEIRDAARRAADKLKIPFYAFVEKCVERGVKKASKLRAKKK
jgi:hypothetical protein